MQAGDLYIKLVNGRNLRAADIGGTSDPFCKLALSNNKKKEYKTPVIKKSLNPDWNFEITIPLELSEREIIILKLTALFYDKDLVGQDSLGGLTILLRD